MDTRTTRTKLNLPADLLGKAETFAIQKDTALNGRIKCKTRLHEAEQIDD